MPISRKVEDKWVPATPAKQPQVARPTMFWGRIGVFFALLGLFSALLGIIGALSRFLGLGINMPGALPISVLSIFWGILALVAASRQNPRTLASKAASVLGVLALLAGVMATAAVAVAPSASPNPDNNWGDGGDGTGHCHSNAECGDFGSRHCEGSPVCGGDSLCHCPFITCAGSNCNVLDCSLGCDANSYCEGGVCVFNQGGLTSD